MSNNPNDKKEFNLEERTTEFAKRVIRLCKSIPRNPINDRITGQLTGSSGSVGANYREANDALGKKDFILRIKISRKEAKEAIHWLECLKEANNEGYYQEINCCIKEATELKNILSSILNKVC
ncbi:MAG: four helix bundle protein [Patescibacteria group bacterium]